MTPTDDENDVPLTWQKVTVTRQQRSALKGHGPKCVWFTGLSGSGKSTLADRLDWRLHQLGVHSMLLDGDNVRQGLCRDLGMSVADRTENIRRVAEVAKLMTDAGLVVVTAFISPFRRDRETARALFAEGEFVEVYVETPLAVCEQRDPKGLYRRAREGEIADFTGVSSPYEEPDQRAFRVSTEGRSPDEVVDTILAAHFSHLVSSTSD